MSFEVDNFSKGGLSIGVNADLTGGTLFRFKTDTGICYEGDLLHRGGPVNVFDKVSEDGSFAGSSDDETPTPTATPTSFGFIPDDGDEDFAPDVDCCSQIADHKSVVVRESGSNVPVDSEDGLTAIGTHGKLCFSDIVGFVPIPPSYLVSLDTDDYSSGGFLVTIQGNMTDTTFRYIKDDTGVCYVGTLEQTAAQGINVFIQE